MKRISVIQIVDSLNVGGTEVMAVNIANSLTQRKVDSHLCATREEGPLKKSIQKNVGYIFLDKRKSLDVRAIKRLKNYIIRNKIKIVHAHSSSFFIASCIRILIPKLSIIWHDHYGNSEFLRAKNLVPIKICSFLFKTVISVNKKLHNANKKRLFSKNYFLLSNFAQFKNSNKTTVLKGQHGKRIIHLANLREEKDHMNLLKSFLLIKEAFTGWSLHLVGKDYNDDYSQSIKDFIKEKDLDQSVYIYDQCFDIQYILSQSTIGVLSSKFEGLPVSLLEYGLSSLPTVVTDVGECSSLISNKSLVSPPEDSKELSKSIIYLIKNEDCRIENGKKLYTLVSKEYSIDSFLKKILEIYRL